MRAEVMQLKTAEADARIQLSVSQNNEKHARQEAMQLRSRLEQMEARCFLLFHYLFFCICISYCKFSKLQIRHNGKAKGR